MLADKRTAHKLRYAPVSLSLHRNSDRSTVCRTVWPITGNKQHEIVIFSNLLTLCYGWHFGSSYRYASVEKLHIYFCLVKRQKQSVTPGTSLALRLTTKGSYIAVCLVMVYVLLVACHSTHDRDCVAMLTIIYIHISYIRYIRMCC